MGFPKREPGGGIISFTGLYHQALRGANLYNDIVHEIRDQ